jgi:FkbM family methyltransferase
VAVERVGRRALRPFGYTIARRDEISEGDRVRQELIRAHDVDLVLDVGASSGTYGASLRAAGYAGRIASFEPLEMSYARLQRASERDPGWQRLPVALGAVAGTAVLNVARNEASSSLYGMEPRHADVEPRSAYVAAQECRVLRLDDLRGGLIAPEDRLYLKLDVQGSELDVLSGADETLEQIEVVEVELSLVRLYTGTPLATEVLEHLDQRGFGLVWLEPAWVDPVTRTILQVDGILVRNARSEAPVTRS